MNSKKEVPHEFKVAYNASLKSKINFLAKNDLGDFFLTGTDELTDMARWIFEITISSDNPSKVMCNNMGF